jgi:hypothetical protein
MNSEVKSVSFISSHDGANQIKVRGCLSTTNKFVLRVTVVNNRHYSSYDEDVSETEIPTVHVVAEDLKKLINHLSHWIAKKELFEIEIRSENDRFVKIELCDDTEFICSIDKPVFRFTYSEHRFAIESRFVVDQSCVQLFINGLEVLADE